MSTTPTSVFGSRINLISHRRVRYEGILSAIDAEKQTVTLHNVRLHGTEGRAALLNLPEIQGSEDVYEYIIFNRQDIYSLSVIESPPPEQPRFPPTGYGYGYSYPFPPYGGGYYPPQQSFGPYMYPPTVSGGGGAFYPVPQSAMSTPPMPPSGSISTNASITSVTSVPAPIPDVLLPPMPIPAMVPPPSSVPIPPIPLPPMTGREPQVYEIPIPAAKMEKRLEYEPTLLPEQVKASATDRKRTGPTKPDVLPSLVASAPPIVKQEIRPRKPRERPPRQVPTQFDISLRKDQQTIPPPSSAPFQTSAHAQVNGPYPPTTRPTTRTELSTKQYDIQAANREFIKEVGLLTDRMKNLEPTRSKDFFDHFSTEESEIRYNNAATFGFTRGRGGRRGRGGGPPSYRGGRGAWGGGPRHPIRRETTDGPVSHKD
jgi:hypothetical protein